jgi:hypothetical protein
MAKLPKAVQEQVDRANAMLAGNPPAEEPAQEVGATPDQGLQGEQPQAEPQPTAPVEPQPETPADTAPAPQADTAEIERIKQALSVLQGKYNAEVPRLTRELRAVTEERDRLKQQIQAAQQNQATPEDIEQLREKYGAEFLDPILNTVTQSVAPLQERVDLLMQRDARTAEDRFWERLSSSVPDWERINTDDNFLLWLTSSQVPFGGGKSFDDLLQDAQARLDANTVSDIFNTWKAQQAAPPAAPAPPQQQQRPANSDISPARRSAGQPNLPQPRIWTRAEVANVYHQKALRRITAEDFVKLEADIALAHREGRIRD